MLKLKVFNFMLLYFRMSLLSQRKSCLFTSGLQDDELWFAGRTASLWYKCFIWYAILCNYKSLVYLPHLQFSTRASHLETIGEWDRLGGPIITNACAPKWFQELLHPKLAWTHSSYSVYRVNKSVMALFYPQSTLFCQVVGCKSSYSSRAVMGVSESPCFSLFTGASG